MKRRYRPGSARRLPPAIETDVLRGAQVTGGGQRLGQGTHCHLLVLVPQTDLEVIAPDPDQPEPTTRRPCAVQGITGGGLI